MISFTTWRTIYRIPLLRENRQAIRILRDIFYVLIALHRESRLHEFSQLRYVYFRMIDSFAQYGRTDAKITIDQIVEIPWFRDNQRDLYRLLSLYNNVVQNLPVHNNSPLSRDIQEQLNADMDKFFQTYKTLVSFDARDEERINKLLENREILGMITESLCRNLSK